MKAVRIALISSLAANAVLVAFLIGLLWRDGSPRGGSAGDAKGGAIVAPSAQSQGDQATPRNLSPQEWSALLGGDLHDLVARLRAAGFPSAMIRAIVTDQVEAQFIARFSALYPSIEVPPYWQPLESPRQNLMMLTIPMRNDTGRLYREKMDLLKDLLGTDAVADPEEARAAQIRQYGNIAPEKIDRLRSVLNNYGELNTQVGIMAKGVILPEDQAKWDQLLQQQRADIAQLLTPAELEEYDAHTSFSGSQLRRAMNDMDASEEEYRVFLKVRQAFDDKYNPRFSIAMDPDWVRERAVAEQQMESQLEAALGSERYANYKIVTEPNYSNVRGLVTRLGLPSSAVTDVILVQRDIQQRAAAVRADQALTVEARNEQLAALSDEATAKITAKLGTSGFEAYRTGGTSWLRNLKPPTPPTSATKP